MYQIISLIALLILITILVRLHNLTKSKRYKFLKTLVKESQGKFKEAKQDYLKFLGKTINNEKYEDLEFDAIVRYSCCVLKSNSNKEISEWIYKYLSFFLDAKNSPKKDEVIFEYILLLYNNKQYEEIPRLISNHLYKKDNQHVKQILEYVKDQINLNINRIIDFANDNLDNPKLYFDIIEQISNNQNILHYSPDTNEQLKRLEPYLLNRLLLKENIDNEVLIKLFYYLIENEDFIQDYALLNNASIISARIVQNNLINVKNYKDVIAVFLTVIFNDNVFLKNLTSTAWDDEHGIYLNNSTGFLNEQFLVQDGLENRTEVLNEKCIDIESTRGFLIRDFETSLIEAKEYLGSLYPAVIDFYETEKKNYINALSDLFPYVNEANNQISTTPHFAYKFKLTNKIFQDYYSYGEISQEEFDAAIPYILLQYEIELNELNLTKLAYLCSDLDGSNLFYQRAKTYISATYVTSRIKNGDLDFIKNYPIPLKNSLSQCLTDDIKKIENALSNIGANTQIQSKDRIIFLKTLVDLIPQAQSLKILLSNELTNDAISKVNSKYITPDQCLDILLESITIHSGNYNTQRNIVLVVSSQCIKMAADYGLYKIIERIINLIDSDLKETLRIELSKAEEELLQYRGQDYKTANQTAYDHVFEELRKSQGRLLYG